MNGTGGIAATLLELRYFKVETILYVKKDIVRIDWVAMVNHNGNNDNYFDDGYGSSD
jgi:hypothetical protein